MIVQLDPDEIVYDAAGRVVSSCMDKDLEDGYCVHLDRQTHQCSDWHNRPKACRRFICDRNPMSAVVLRYGVGDVVWMASKVKEITPDDPLIPVNMDLDNLKQQRRPTNRPDNATDS